MVCDKSVNSLSNSLLSRIEHQSRIRNTLLQISSIVQVMYTACVLNLKMSFLCALLLQIVGVTPSSPPTIESTIEPTADPTRVSTVFDEMFIGDEPMNFNDARDYCMSLGRDLLSIHSTKTQEAAEDLCSSFNHSAVKSWGCWTGLCLSNDNQWIWSDGSATDYGFHDNGTAIESEYPWLNNQPDGHEDCVHLYRGSYRWNDLWDDWLNVPICKGKWPTSSPTIQPTRSPTIEPSIEPTNEPTTYPTSDPTMAPSTSPTQHPITYSEFVSSVTASFNITGWTSSEISDVNKDINLFTIALTTYVHQGLDNDDHLEYQHIVLNVTSINDYALHQLLEMRDSAVGDVLWQSIAHGMDVHFLIECSNSIKCLILSTEDPSNGIDRVKFESFLSNKLNLHFNSTDFKLMIADITSNDNPSYSTTTSPNTTSMTIYPEDIEKGENSNMMVDIDQYLVYILMTFTLFCVLCCIFGIVYRKYWRKSPLIMSNALVAMISIGNYSDGGTMTSKEVLGEFINLPVEKDIENVKELCEFMGWTFVSKGQKVHWTEKEITSFIKTEIGEMLFTEDGSLDYDGLIVCFSGHGIKNNVVTSDFKAMEKTAIHRMLSLKYPTLREIPRIFVFDCCNGTDQRQVTIREYEDISKAIDLTVSPEMDKNIDLDHSHESIEGQSWTTSTKNPDYNLVEIHAANSGYKAKMNYKGSYLVYLLVTAIKRNVGKFIDHGLAELLAGIQNALHDSGRQQTVNILNNYTRTLVFKKNKR